LDVDRDFCESRSRGRQARRAGRVATRPAELELFAHSLGEDDRIVLEATGDALAIARILAPHVGEVVFAHSRKVRAIAEAKQQPLRFLIHDRDRKFSRSFDEVFRSDAPAGAER